MFTVCIFNLELEKYLLITGYISYKYYFQTQDDAQVNQGKW